MKVKWQISLLLRDFMISIPLVDIKMYAHVSKRTQQTINLKVIWEDEHSNLSFLNFGSDHHVPCAYLYNERNEVYCFQTM